MSCNHRFRSATSVVLLCFCASLVLLFSAEGWAALGNGPWPMFRHDLKHTGLSPNHDPAPGGTFWKTSVGNGFSGIAIGSDNTIYTSGSTGLCALYSTGGVKWTYASGSSRSTPAIGSDNVIYVGGGSRLYAINSNGTLKWSFTTGNTVSASPAIGPDNVIYIGSRDGKLYALNPTGTKKWERALADMHMTSPALSSTGVIYVGGGSNLNAVNAATGAVIWKYPTGDAVLSTPALNADESVIYVGCYDGYLYAINSDGTLRWRFLAGFKNGSTTSSPAVGPDGTIYIGSNYGSVYALSPEGVELWHFETRDDIRASPAISADGTIYVGGYNGWFYALNPDGTEKWHFLVNGGIYGSPAIAADGSVVLIGTNGYVYGNLRSTPPTATPPTDLVATALSETSVRLVWQDNSSNEYGFRIERKTGETGSWTFVTNVGANVETYDNSGLSSGQMYTYRVCAYQEGGYSAYSNEAQVTTPGLPAPTGMVATPISASQVDLSWTDRASDELGFKIERSTGPNGHFQQIATVGANVQSYSDLSVNPATNYYYRARAFDATRNSSYSNEDWALTPGKDFTNVTIGDTTRHQMALTFDAGTASIRSGLLTLLRTRKLYCTFFITGLVAEAQPAQVAQIALDGHHLGNHTYDHPDLRDCPDAEIIWQFGVTDDILYGITGHHTQSYFRAPYGLTDARVLQTSADAGYRHIYWTQDCGDASWNASTQEIIDRTMAAATNGCIMLYHCTVANTEAAMPTIIDNLQAQGYELVTVPEILAPTVATAPEGVINPGWNLLSLPIEPATPTPWVVFRGLPTLDGKLYKWNKETASMQTFDSYEPEAFGTISPDEGYWLYLDAPYTLKCAGAEITNDRHIKLPQAPSGTNWTAIGYPFSTAQEWSNCSVYNPNAAEPKTRSVAQAAEAGWISSALWWWDSATQALVDCNLPDYWPTTTQVEPWHGYWLQNNVSELELIIPAP